MLRGQLIYRDEDFGEIKLEVLAKDSFDSLKLLLQNKDLSSLTNYQNVMSVFDKVIEYTEQPNPIGSLTPTSQVRSVSVGYQDDNPPENRRLDIQKSNKFKTNVTNREFCARISSLVRFAQTETKKNYNMNVAEDDYFNTERIVNLDGVGYIKYNMALISELSLVSPYVSLHLSEIDDSFVESGLFKELKEKNNYGNILSTTPVINVAFKLSQELLGFAYTPPIIREPANLFGLYENIEDVIEAHPEKNTEWILHRDYHIVSQDNLEEIWQMFMNHDGKIAFDTETTGLKINFKSRSGEADELVGVVLSIKKGTGYYFPLQHKAFDNLCDGDHWYFMERYMKPLLETKEIICHNLQYDWKVAYIYNINVNVVYDTIIAFGVTKRYEDPSFKYGLKALAQNLLGLDMFDLSDFVISGSFGDSDITFADLSYELVRRYAPADADLTLTLYEYLQHHQILEKFDAWTVFEMEVNFAKAVAYSEFYGYHINVDNIPAMEKEIVGGMEKHMKAMFGMAGEEFNPNSPAQLLRIMHDVLGIEKLTDKPSTNKETLKALSEKEDVHGNKKYPFVVELKKYRDNEGIYKNFLKRLPEFSTSDGFIFPDVQQLGTNTGRSSIKNPNYQGYNDPVKKNVSPRAGYFSFDCDFSQIEYRVLASMAQQDKLMMEFNDADLDYHTYQASRMFSIPYSLVPKELRQQSKGINFGLPYGMGDSSLGARIFGERNKENERKAGALRRKFFQGQEKIEIFFERVRSEGVSNNFTSTKFGRRRYYQKEKFTAHEIRRQAGNHVIQGTAADVYKIACNRMFNRIVAEGWLGLVLLNAFVHDELLMEVHKSINPYYFFKAWREEFELAIDGFCKLFAGAGVGYNWYDAKKQDLPPQYIERIVKKYESDPDMEWDEDFDKFLKDVKVGYEQYKVDRVLEYITDPVNEGVIIKPIVYALLVEKTDDAIKGVQASADAKMLVATLNNLLGEDLVFEQENDKKIHKIKTLDQYLKVFLYFYPTSNQVYSVRSADEEAVTTNQDNGFDDIEVPPSDFQSDRMTIEDTVQMTGYYLDDDNRILYFKDMPFTYDGLPTTLVNYMMSQNRFETSGRYQVAQYFPDNRTVQLYNAFLSEANYQSMLGLYNAINRQAMTFSPLRY